MVSSLYTDLNGGFTIYLPEGTYDIEIDGETVKSLEVTQDIKKTIVLDYYEVSGTVCRREGVEWEMVSLCFDLQLEDGGPKSFYTNADENGKYTTFLPRGNYNVRTSNGTNLDMGTLTVTDDVANKEFITDTDIYKVSGTLFKTEGESWTNCSMYFYPCSEEADSQSYNTYTNWDGEYTVYLPAGTYKISLDPSKVKTIEVSEDMTSKDIVWSE